MNKVLLEQLRQFVSEPGKLPPEIRSLLEAVSDTYDRHEQELASGGAELALLNQRISEDANELRQKDTHLRSSQQLGRIGSWELNLTEPDQKEFWSDETYSIFGLDPAIAVITDEVLFPLIHPDDRLMVNTAFMTSVQARQPYEIEYRLVNSTYVQEKTRIVSDPVTGLPAKMVGTVQDITIQKKAERALEEAHVVLKMTEHRFRALIQNATDLITVSDENGVRIFVSDSVEGLYGYKPEELIGRSSFSLVHPDYLEITKEFMRTVLAEPNQPRTLIYKAMRKDGSVAWCDRITTNFLHDPAIRGVVSNIRDITDRMEKEEALRASHEELRKKNEELDRFVYSVSHDLRAPLTSILGLTELSRMETSLDEVHMHVEMIQSSVHKLDAFIRDILDYSKNSRLELMVDAIDFKAMLEGITDNLRFINADTRPVEITYVVSEGPPFYSDRYRLGVVLNNLISNAIKYSNPQQLHPYVRIRVAFREGAADILVEDNGIGVAPEFQEKIFAMFFRASSASVGSGLGLYIVRETLAKLGGSISVESAPGVGTSFRLEIPDART